MTKSIKKLTAVFLTVIMVFGMLGVTAFASGTINAEVSGTGSSTRVQYNYTVYGSSGATSTTGISIVNDGYYSLDFSTSSVRATIKFYKQGGNALYTSFTTPTYFSGMPATLSTSINLAPGQYYVVICPYNSSETAGGFFRINGVGGTFKH